MNDTDTNTTDLSSKNASTAIEKVRSHLLWNDIVYRIQTKGDHKPRRRFVSEPLFPELTIGKYEELIIEQLKLEKSISEFRPKETDLPSYFWIYLRSKRFRFTR